MSNLKWVDNHIEIEPTKKPKFISGTRFPVILGANKWQSDFEVWCALCRVYEEFVETKYVTAGKAIEPLQIKYMKRAYGMTNLLTPEDKYGKDFFKKTWGNFFPEQPPFSGMWDSLLIGDNGEVDAVLEFKTTKRSEDWQTDIPEYYALQASLYAYLLGTDNVIMVASFLEDKDYDAPEKYVPTVENTITREFLVSERYPDFAEKVQTALDWWQTHVVTGISPVFDEKKDLEILKALRTHNLSPDTDINELIAEAESLKAEVDGVAKQMVDKEKRLKELNDLIKEHALTQFRDGDKKVELKGSTYTWAIARSETTTIDKKALEADGLLDKYQKKSEQFRMTIK